MIVFSQISSADSPELQDAIAIYTDSFPANERHRPEVIRERLARGRYRLVIGRDRAETLFFALLWPLEGTDFVLLDFMATKSGHRGRGFGSAFLKMIAATPEMAGKFLLMEVEDPASGGNAEQRARRVEFYRRQGARELEGVPYFMPGLAGGPPTAMILMILPDYDAGRIDAAIVRSLIVQIYKELYHRDSNDSLLKSFVGEIKGRIRLK